MSLSAIRATSTPIYIWNPKVSNGSAGLYTLKIDKAILAYRVRCGSCFRRQVWSSAYFFTFIG